jgi:hypothetical protein
MFHSIYTQLAVIALIVCCGLALLKGGPAERAGAALIGVTWVAVLGASAAAQSYVPAIVFLASDAILALGLLILAIRYSSWWLGAAMLLQGLVLSLHAAHFAPVHAEESIQVLNLYILGKNLASMAVLLTVLAGTLVSWRQRVVGSRPKTVRRAGSAKRAPRPTPAA